MPIDPFTAGALGAAGRWVVQQVIKWDTCDCCGEYQAFALCSTYQCCYKKQCPRCLARTKSNKTCSGCGNAANY